LENIKVQWNTGPSSENASLRIMLSDLDYWLVTRWR